MTFLWLHLLGDTELWCILQALSKVPLLLSPHTHALKEGLRREHRPREASDMTARCGLVALTHGCDQAPRKQKCKQISVSHRESLGVIRRLCWLSGPTWGQFWSTASTMEETVLTHFRVPSNEAWPLTGCTQLVDCLASTNEALGSTPRTTVRRGGALPVILILGR